MSGSGGRFVHEPLDLSEPTVRVLKILPGTSATIRCRLKHIRLRQQNYTCLSYTWGEGPASMTIYINGAKFVVRQNLFNFLQLARKLEVTTLWLWIAAICIDQNNAAEKNEQVSMIGEIVRQPSLYMRGSMTLTTYLNHYHCCRQP